MRISSRCRHHERLHTTNRLLRFHIPAEYMLVDPCARIGDGSARLRLRRVRRLLVRACEEQVECARDGEPLAVERKVRLFSEWRWFAAGWGRVVDDLSSRARQIEGLTRRRGTTGMHLEVVAPRHALVERKEVRLRAYFRRARCGTEWERM